METIFLIARCISSQWSRMHSLTWNDWEYQSAILAGNQKLYCNVLDYPLETAPHSRQYIGQYKPVACRLMIPLSIPTMYLSI